jgi:hypothetical protein
VVTGVADRVLVRSVYRENLACRDSELISLSDVSPRIAAGRGGGGGLQPDVALISKPAGSVNPWVAVGITEPPF